MYEVHRVFGGWVVAFCHVPGKFDESIKRVVHPTREEAAAVAQRLNREICQSLGVVRWPEE